MRWMGWFLVALLLGPFYMAEAMDRRVRDMERAFDDAWAKAIEQHGERVAALQASYAKALEAKRKAAIERGDLHAVVALRDEIARFEAELAGRDAGVDESAEQHESVAAMRNAFGKALEAAEETRDRALLSLSASYRDALEAFMRRMTVAGDIEVAREALPLAEGAEERIAYFGRKLELEAPRPSSDAGGDDAPLREPEPRDRPDERENAQTASYVTGVVATGSKKSPDGFEYLHTWMLGGYGGFATSGEKVKNVISFHVRRGGETSLSDLRIRTVGQGHLYPAVPGEGAFRVAVWNCRGGALALGTRNTANVMMTGRRDGDYRVRDVRVSKGDKPLPAGFVARGEAGGFTLWVRREPVGE